MPSLFASSIKLLNSVSTEKQFLFSFSRFACCIKTSRCLMSKIFFSFSDSSSVFNDFSFSMAFCLTELCIDFSEMSERIDLLSMKLTAVMAMLSLGSLSATGDKKLGFEHLLTRAKRNSEEGILFRSSSATFVLAIKSLRSEERRVGKEG